MSRPGEDIPNGPLTLEVVIQGETRFTLSAPAFGVLPDLASGDLNGITVTVEE